MSNVYLKNKTSSAITVAGYSVYYIDKTNAAVVHVYDKATGVAYNAFKYTLEGTDYYYILDGVQSDWTDDIDSLGFALGDGFTEIKLYGNVSSTIACQNNVTSGFTGNVSTSNICQLYTDSGYTTPWTGFNYSNDYDLGVYSSGTWHSRGGTVADLPSTTADPGNGETVTKLFILLDTGALWFVCNNSNGNYGYNNQHAQFYGSITLRIYPKAQQHFAAYAYGASTYGNVQIGQSTSKQCVSKPGSTEYIQTPLDIMRKYKHILEQRSISESIDLDNDDVVMW